MATPYRIASGTTAAALSPIFEAVRKHDFVRPAFHAEFQLADRTTHQPPPRYGSSITAPLRNLGLMQLTRM
jgi:hypothetical protein